MEIILTIAILSVVFEISLGLYFYLKGIKTSEGRLKKVVCANLLAFVPVFMFLITMSVPQFINAQAEGSVNGLGLIAAGLSTGLAALGAGVAVANVGSSAIGAVSEDPKILGKSMIFLGLAEGIAIYGLIISIMILGKL